MKRIERILIANRGEIACRVIRTCRRMGIETVAVFSDADADAPFVRLADVAMRIGPPPAAESYLVIDRILEAARTTGADAIHPGYGFLSENAAFAAACAEAGFTFIGPRPEVIRVLGSKQLSKRKVQAADVPVIPGHDGDGDQATGALAARAKEVGFPLLLKASAGGGGKGMRVVRDPAALEDAIESAKREAKGAFGDDTMLIERYIDRPRHVEIQILGDEHGSLVHLFERECSIQRRHQKIIEEAPSPALTAELRERMGQAAVRVGQAVGYTNAGTVEFILDPEGNFYFLEVNTRLQVEHPITECVTGLDLVREQIRVARGERLDIDQGALELFGAAIECRLYAEDPARGFLPTSGRVIDWHVPDLEGLRVDTGIESGSEVSIHYDPMLAKLICHAPTRTEALQLMARSLEGLCVQGVTTNRAFLLAVLDHPEFRAGNVDTHFLETHADEVHAGRMTEEAIRAAAIAATLAAHERARRRARPLPALEPGFRNNRFQSQWIDFRSGERLLQVRYDNLGGGRLELAVDGGDAEIARVVSARGADLVFEDGQGVRRRFRICRDGEIHYLQSREGSLALLEQPRFPEHDLAQTPGACVAPMPGKVVKLLVTEGQQVEADEPLVVLEAMKMEHIVRASDAGVVKELAVAEGDQVDADTLLAVVQDQP
jgi:acetyl-CoA carboxylase biotin carboxylase subunit